MIKIVPRFTKADITKMMDAKRKQIEKAIISRFKFIGEKFISMARTEGNYKDRTGNLRASIGYVILKDGQQLKSSFPGSTKDGKRQARKVISESIKDFPKGFVLIVVAGMEYAAAVESRGLDVLTASSKVIEVELKKSISELSKKLDRAA